MIILGLDYLEDYAVEYELRGNVWTGLVPEHVASITIEVVCIQGMWSYLDALYYFRYGDHIVFYKDDDKIIQASH